MLFGAEVRLGWAHLEHIYATRCAYPVEKLFGDGHLLRCFATGHSSCLPDCDPGGRCEFPNHLVHPDFNEDEYSPYYWPQRRHREAGILGG